MPRKTMRGGVHPSKKVASTDVVELYGNALCPCSNAVRLCLYEKHVAFKFHGVRLVVPDGDFGNLRRAYLRVNPGGIVPTLVHEGRPVYESRRCLDYVDEVMPGKSLVPRAVAEAVGAWCDRCAVEGHGDFAPESATRSLGSCAMTLGAPLEAALAQDVGANALRRGLFQGRRRWPLLLLSLKRWGPNFVAKMPNLMMALKTALEQARRHLDTLETDLGDGRPWACGPDYTLADVSLTATLDRLVVADWGSLVDRRPRVAAYWRRLRDRPSYAACLGSQRPLALEVGMSRLRDWKRTDPGFAAVLDLGAGRAAPGRTVAPELNLRRASAPAQRRSIFSSVASTAKEGFRRASLAVAPAPPAAPAAPPPAAPAPWAISAEDKARYDQVFTTLQQDAGRASGATVRPVLERSGLSVDMLRTVWNLSDIDRDGHLDADEFAVAMHLCREATTGKPLPPTLPPNLVPPSKR